MAQNGETQVNTTLDGNTTLAGISGSVSPAITPEIMTSVYNIFSTIGHLLMLLVVGLAACAMLGISVYAVTRAIRKLAKPRSYIPIFDTDDNTDVKFMVGFCRVFAFIQIPVAFFGFASSDDGVIPVSALWAWLIFGVLVLAISLGVLGVSVAISKALQHLTRSRDTGRESLMVSEEVELAKGDEDL